MKDLVTGCAGFIGSYLTDTLSESYISRVELGWFHKGPIDVRIHSLWDGSNNIELKTRILFRQIDVINNRV